MFDVDEVMHELAKRREIFHSEADFQHALAWEIHRQCPEAIIRLERTFSVNGEKGPGKIHLDLWVTQGNTAIAIELKYKTRKLEEIINSEPFNLSNHGAQDLGRYDYIKDICRLETLTKLGLGPMMGMAILLTNESTYWDKPRNEKTVDAAFRLTDKRELAGELHWGSGAANGTTKGRTEPLSIKGKYPLNWRNYPTSRFGFRYLATLVK